MKHTRLLLLATALAISLTACGGSQSNTPADTPAEPETSPSVAAIDDAVAAIQEEAEQMAQTSESITPKNPSKILPKESRETPEAFPSSYALEADSPTEAYSKVLWYIFQYGLLPGETSWPTYTYSERAPAEAAVDGPVYEAWRGSILQDGQPAKVPWLSLTRENIAALGYPEPEMPDWRSYIPG